MVLRYGVRFLAVAICAMSLLGCNVHRDSSRGLVSDREHRRNTVKIWKYSQSTGVVFQYVSGYIEPCMSFKTGRDMKGVSGSVALVASDSPEYQMRAAVYADAEGDARPNLAKCLGSVLVAAKSPRVLSLSAPGMPGGLLVANWSHVIEIPELRNADGQEVRFSIPCVLARNTRYWLMLQLPGVGSPTVEVSAPGGGITNEPVMPGLSKAGETTFPWETSRGVHPMPGRSGYALLRCSNNCRRDHEYSWSKVVYMPLGGQDSRAGYMQVQPLISRLDGDQ